MIDDPGLTTSPQPPSVPATPVAQVAKALEQRMRQVATELGNASAGEHWQAAMELLATSKLGAERSDQLGVREMQAAVWSAQLAQAHLEAARLLLDHPPVDVLDAYPPERGVQPPKDWRDDRA